MYNMQFKPSFLRETANSSSVGLEIRKDSREAYWKLKNARKLAAKNKNAVNKLALYHEKKKLAKTSLKDLI